MARSSIGNIFAGDADASCSADSDNVSACEILGGGKQPGVVDTSCQIGLKHSIWATLASPNMLLGPQRENAQLVVTLATGGADPGNTIVIDVAKDREPPKVAVA
ncbi:MAG: hypothetical protein KDI60_07110 [Xanthomonadales bacterium]|nr:hypothetical protein [Xanthomonadales bacterium]MCB1611511.1 hypothetical protein [Xanthomonadales bacterium]